MFDWIYKGFLEDVQTRISDIFTGAADYIYLGGWYSVGIGILLVCAAARIFVPFKWIQAAAGFIVWGVMAFLAGMTVMFNYMRNKKKVEQPKPPPPEHVPKPDEWWRFL